MFVNTNVTLVARRIACLCVCAIVTAGCASATVTPTVRASDALPRPDMIVVYDFAVTYTEISLDRGEMATSVRTSSGRSTSAEEAYIGRLVANQLSASLVQELRRAGIPAVRAGGTFQPSMTTAFITGAFLNIDQGNQSARVWVGFGLGGSEIRTRVQVTQGNRVVARAETATSSSLKPGMAASIGASVATGGAAPALVGAAGVGVSETLTATVDADAKRTAQELANRLIAAYRQRGWLAPG